MVVVTTIPISSGKPSKNIKGDNKLFKMSTKPNSCKILTIINVGIMILKSS